MKMARLRHPSRQIPCLLQLSLLLQLLLLQPSPTLQSSLSAATKFKSNEEGFISVAISEKGLVFVKDLLVNRSLTSIASAELPAIEKSIKVPFIGRVHARLDNISVTGIEVSSSEVRVGESGLVIVASGATVNLSLDWSYSYTAWLLPVEISDRGRASVLVEGMEIGLTIGVDIQDGTLKLHLMDSGCMMKDMVIKLDGGASWFYQGLVDAFEGKLSASVENAITNKIKNGVTKLDNFSQNLPKRVLVDEVAELNVTFVNQPILDDSSVELDINGLFTAKEKTAFHKFYGINFMSSESCQEGSKMLSMSLHENVFNSAADVYFAAGVMHWIVDKVPQQSFLNTAAWKYIVPQLYKKYPNDDMRLNISINSPPLISLANENIRATILSDMIIEVVDNGEVIPVACITVEARASGMLRVIGNNLAGQAGLDSFALNLKWSKIGNFHMYLIERTVWVFLKDVAVPFANVRLKKGFPLPVIRGFFLEDADILCSNSRIVVCSNVAYTE